ncbi:MAG: Yip1 protein [Pseudomonadota bacterium]|nr:Yip1 protein [Pseudomonadota bacterium]
MTPLLDLFLLRPQAYVHACQNQRAPWWISAFLILVGVVYGLLVAVLQRTIGGELQGIPIANIPFWVLALGNMLPGVLIAIMVHIGAMLVAWLMAKALGGPGDLGALYRVTGYLFPLSLPGLPAVAFTVAATTVTPPATGPMPLLYQLLAMVGTVLLAAGLYQALRVTQGFTPIRAALATILFATFSTSILALA